MKGKKIFSDQQEIPSLFPSFMTKGEEEMSEKAKFSLWDSSKSKTIGILCDDGDVDSASHGFGAGFNNKPKYRLNF